MLGRVHVVPNDSNLDTSRSPAETEGMMGEQIEDVLIN
jgi:hypothetical protein